VGVSVRCSRRKRTDTKTPYKPSRAAEAAPEQEQEQDDDADRSLTAEEEAEWDQWLQRAKAAEEAALAQHLQHQPPQPQTPLELEQQSARVGFRDDDMAAHEEEASEDEPSADFDPYAGIVESVDV
jgi:hypothetical protein